MILGYYEYLIISMNDVYKQSGFALIKRGAFAAAGPFRRHFLIPLLSYLLPPGSCIVSLNSNVLLSVTLLHIHFAIPLGKKNSKQPLHPSSMSSVAARFRECCLKRAKRNMACASSKLRDKDNQATLSALHSELQTPYCNMLCIIS